jgi:hypothetical protein
MLTEPLPRVMFSPLPVIHMEPVDSLLGQREQHPALARQQQQDNCAAEEEAGPLGGPRGNSSSSIQERGWYPCPLYKTSQRSGALSTRGVSTNFVVHMLLPTDPDSHPSSWVQQGVAALCALESD